ncbi:MAG: neutral/alkaline non-lysosomal ceramidase N-terminal domain-containing protein [Bryobacterales bacterium]|nr:neutral/alkaline non-lysosomal ceramidase N-terminal domain-containing protein [Bryobacterales bacterium]
MRTSSAGRRKTELVYGERSFAISPHLCFRVTTVAMTLVLLLASVSCARRADMRAGVGTETITPQEMPFWLSGYAARTAPASEVRQQLFAKALALEDAQGARSVIVTIDIIGIPRVLRNAIADDVERLHGLKPEALLLNCSHTHSGPAVRENLEVLFSFDDEEKAKTARYREFLRQRVVAAVGGALASLEPVNLSYGEGSAPFAINRRAQRLEAEDPSANPVRTVDHSVPVLRVERQDGGLLAVLFGYACHNTTLTAEFNAVAGDYAGYAQQEVQNANPGVTALFLMLCGGDQNPFPRSKEELAPQHGQTLARAVQEVLSKPGELEALSGGLRSALRFERLPFETHTRADFEQERNNENVYRKRRAEWVLGRMDKGDDLNAVEYPVQVLRLGERFGLVGLGGEVVVDYGLNIKQAYPGIRLVVAGYTNDVMCYIPNRRILKEGGYEADDSMMYYGQPGKFIPEVEDKVMGAVKAAMADVGFVR